MNNFENWRTNIPKTWDVCRIKDILDNNHPYPIGDGDHGEIKPSMYKTEGYPYIRVQNLSWGKELDYNGMVFLDEETQRKNSKSILYPDDILIAKTGATIGKTAIVPKEVPEANTTSSVAKLTIDKTKNCNYFIFYVVQSNVVQDAIWEVASQKTAQPGFNICDIKNTYIPLPPLHEQQAIATYLDDQVSRLDRLIKDQQRVIEEWKAYKQSLITETVTKGLNPEVEFKESGIEWIGEIPSHWVTTKLSKVASFYNGDRSSKYPKESDYVSEGIPFINAGDLSNGTISLDKANFISKEKYQDLGGAKLEVDDILYCLRGSLGKVGYNKSLSAGTLASSLLLIRASDISRYIYYILNSEIELIQRIFSENGTAQPNLSAKSVGKYEIPIPPLHEQQQIADFLDEKCSKIDQLIENKQRLIEELKAYKQSLIYECVTGKKEIV